MTGYDPHSTDVSGTATISDVSPEDDITYTVEADGYNTDMTRVGVAGNPTDEVKRVYSIVLKADMSNISG